MKQTNPAESIASNSFVRMLGELRKGNVVSEASTELARVVQEVENTGKPGELTIKLKIRPNADGETVEITDKIDAKVPKADRKATNFFMGEDGSLLRNDPKQVELFTAHDGGAEAVAETHARMAANG